MNCHSERDFKVTPQQDRILKYIRDFGSITPLEAFRDLSITKLATRISELKKNGYEFSQRIDCGINRYGEPVHYMRYSFPVLEEDEQ